MLEEGAQERLVINISGHLGNRVGSDALARALEHWRLVDPDLGDRVAKAASR